MGRNQFPQRNGHLPEMISERGEHMRKVKKIFAVILAAALLFAIMPVSAFAEEPAGKVWISFVDYGVRAAEELSDIPEEYKTPLGVIIEPEEFDYYEGENIAEVTLRFLKEIGITAKNSGSAASDFYLQSISGFTNPKTGVNNAVPLAEKTVGSGSGWMITLNDWFINYGASAFAVSDGDLIVWQLTCQYGADIGGGFSVTGGDTTLKTLSAEGGTLSAQKTSSVSGITGEYDLVINGATGNVKLTPTANNKNFLVKAFLNAQVKTTDEAAGIFYKCTQQIPVKAGDKIYIGVGETAWPSMNSGQTPSWYVVNVYMLGDVSGDGKINNYDATLLRKHIAGTSLLTDEQRGRSDTSGDGKINNYDATLLRKFISKTISSFN